MNRGRVDGAHRDGREVYGSLLAVLNDVAFAGHDELEVELTVLKHFGPVVDLDAGEDGVVGLSGVHGLRYQALEVLPEERVKRESVKTSLLRRI